MQQREDEQCDDRHDRDRRQDAPDDIGKHGLVSGTAIAPHPGPLPAWWGEGGTRASGRGRGTQDRGRSLLLDLPPQRDWGADDALALLSVGSRRYALARLVLGESPGVG